MPSRSGLPDEAVEAMCECNRQLGHESWCPLYEMRAWVPLVVAERLVAAGTATIDTNSGTVYVQPSAAALPAGVYVSDGQGRVEPAEPRWYVYTCRSCDRVRLGLSDGGLVKERFEPRCDWHPRERLIAVPVAALSATDTEKAGDGAE